ncbi:hypothetical protein LSAT2_026989 [Lamellibrachia satsuma]|nr:hypothetical protein LSAT2_026989 [Lamellibrachia satsuma]
MLVVVRLAAADACPKLTPHSCTCSEVPFAVNCIDNNLTTIPDDLPKAPSMTIKDNNIVVLTSIPYTNLVKLLLVNNKITVITENAFKLLTNLTKLVLSNNKITNLGDQAFAGLEVLSTLVLQGNPLYHVTSAAFSGPYLPALSNLKMSHCSIYEISEHSFVGLTKLQVLNISYNHITNLTSAVGGTQLGALVTLDASHNWIVSIGDSNFAGLTKLDTLILSENKITKISSQAFNGLSGSLTALDLSHNQLSDISRDAFKHLSVLKKLSLQFNSLVTLDVSAIPWGNAASTILLVHDNPWRCNCDMKWLAEKKFVSKWNDNGTTKCATPKELAGEHVFDADHSVFHHCYHSVSTSVIVFAVFVSLLAVVVVGFLVYRRYLRGRLRSMTSTASDKVKVLSPPYRRM